MFGRDEEENIVLKLRQADVDDAVTLASALLGGKMPMPFPLQAPHSEMLLNFSEETGEALTWENMDAEFVKRMKEWRTSKPANFFRKGYKDDTAVAIGTVRRWVKTVRSWITQARALGVHPFDHHLHPEWKVSEGDVLRFALTSQQLRDFFEWEVPADTNGGGERTGIKKVRDLFVLHKTLN